MTAIKKGKQPRKGTADNAIVTVSYGHYQVLALTAIVRGVTIKDVADEIIGAYFKERLA